MFKFIVLIGIILLNSACFGLSKKKKQILIGEWESSKEITLKSIQSEELKNELSGSRLGKTSYIFKPSYTTFGEIDANHKTKLVWKVNNTNANEISIYIGLSSFNMTLVSFNLELKGCIGLINTNYSINFMEYFCKKERGLHR